MLSSSSPSGRHVLDVHRYRLPLDAGDGTQRSKRVGSALLGGRQVARDEVGVLGMGSRGQAPQDLHVGELDHDRPCDRAPVGGLDGHSASDIENPERAFFEELLQAFRGSDQPGQLFQRRQGGVGSGFLTRRILDHCTGERVDHHRVV